MSVTRNICCTLIVCALCNYAGAQPTDPVFRRIARPAQKGDGNWTGSLGGGLTVNRGNNNSSQVSVSVEAIRALRDSRMVFQALGFRDKSAENTTAENALARARYERNLSEHWFGFSEAAYERDPFKDLSMGQSYSLGAGYRFLHWDDLQINLYSGFAYTKENYRSKPDASGIEFLFGNDLNYRLNENVSITQRMVVFPNTVGDGGGRSVFQAGLNTKLIGRFGLQVSFLHKYREKVQANEENSDAVIFTGLTAKF